MPVLVNRLFIGTVESVTPRMRIRKDKQDGALHIQARLAFKVDKVVESVPLEESLS